MRSCAPDVFENLRSTRPENLKILNFYSIFLNVVYLDFESRPGFRRQFWKRESGVLISDFRNYEAQLFETLRKINPVLVRRFSKAFGFQCLPLYWAGTVKSILSLGEVLERVLLVPCSGPSV